MKKKDRNLETPENGEQLEKSVEEEVCPESEGKEACIEEWREALEQAVCQRDEYLDCLRRTQADFQNFRRRNQAARADGYDDGAREVLAEMIPVLDNLERAVKAATEEGPLLEGVRMTLCQLFEAMKKFGRGTARRGPGVRPGAPPRGPEGAHRRPRQGDRGSAEGLSRQGPDRPLRDGQGLGRIKKKTTTTPVARL